MSSPRPLWKTFLAFLAPMMLSNILQSLSGTINNVYLGQMIGVDALAAAAMAAVGQVLIVVRAHGGREAGDVVAPTGENIPHHLINAAGGVGSAVHWKC